MRNSNYNLGYKKDAWKIPLSSLFYEKQTFSKESFYSKEIFKEVKRIYKEDYDLLSRFNIETIEINKMFI